MMIKKELAKVSYNEVEYDANKYNKNNQINCYFYLWNDVDDNMTWTVVEYDLWYSII